jgi:hypothetical protein
MVVRVYSEFGRTPLNNNNGKDHWSIGSQIIMEANPPGVTRVRCQWARHQQLKIDPATGAVDAVNGQVIKPRNIHTALQKYLGFTTTDPKFAMKIAAAETFDFFNPNAKTGYPSM